MLNVRNLIVDAFKMIGEIGDQEALDGTRSTVGLQLLNDIISTMNLDSFFSYKIDTTRLTPTTSKFAYSIGRTSVSYPTVDIDIDRPSKLLRVYSTFKATGDTSQEVTLVAPQDLPMFTVDSVSLPTYCTYNSGYPQSSIEFNTQLSLNYDILITYNSVVDPVAFNDIVEMPPEYEPSLKYALAYLLSQRYGKDDTIKVGMKSLRDTAYASIQNNTTAKTPLMAHMGNQSIGQNNIFNKTRFGI